MPLNLSTIKNNFEAAGCYNDVLSCSFGIHTSLTTGIPSYRIVYLNTEAKDVNESITDNGTVGYAGTPDATAVVAGVVKDGCTYTGDEVYLPGMNRDFNVTVTILGTMLVEIGAGEVVPSGTNLEGDAEGRGVATGNGGGPTGIFALSGASGVGTADNPEYVVAIIR